MRAFAGEPFPRRVGTHVAAGEKWYPLAPMDDRVTLVTVASFPDVAEAELAKERLALEGIRAFVLGAQTAGIMPFLTGATGGVRVQVDPKDAIRAREILAT